MSTVTKVLPVKVTLTKKKKKKLVRNFFMTLQYVLYSSYVLKKQTFNQWRI